MADELDDLMADYERRKRSESEANKAGEVGEDEARDHATKAMRTIAEPVFEDLAERLRGAGHQVDVTQTLEGAYVSPRLELRFRAKAIDTRRQHELPEGRLRLMWSTTDGTLVFEDEEASSKGTFPTHGPTHCGVHELTADMVQTRIVGLVKRTMAQS